MSGAADQQSERRFEHLDERPDVAREGADLGRLRRELLLRGEHGGVVDRRIPEGAFARAVGLHDDPGSGLDVIARGLEHRHHADGPLLLERHPQGARDLGGAIGRFDEDLDRAVAAQAEAPHLVVVGREVPAGQPRPALLHDDPGHVGDVALQAAAGDVADRSAVLGDQQPCAGPTVRRSADRDDRGERHPFALGGQGLDRVEHVADLAHTSMVRSPRERARSCALLDPTGGSARGIRVTGLHSRAIEGPGPSPVRKEGSP